MEYNQDFIPLHFVSSIQTEYQVVTPLTLLTLKFREITQA